MARTDPISRTQQHLTTAPEQCLEEPEPAEVRSREAAPLILVGFLLREALERPDISTG